MKMNRLDPRLGVLQNFQRGHSLVRRKAELRGKRRVFRIELLAGQNADAQPPVEMFGVRQQRVQFGGRIQVHREFGQIELREPVVFGGAVDQNVFRRETFSERGAQFQLADDFDGAALLPPPAEQRPDGLGLEREPMACFQRAAGILPEVQE